MATNAERSNSVNWRSIKTKFCLKIFSNMYSLPSNHEDHICHDIKIMCVFIVLSPESRFQTETWIRGLAYEQAMYYH